MVVGAVKSPQISPVVRCGISILQQSRKRGHLRSGDCRMLSPRHILLVLAMLLIIGGAWGQSRPPPMTIRQQSQTQSQQQKTESDQRGTEQLPLVVQPLSTKKTAEERQRDYDDRGHERRQARGQACLRAGAGAVRSARPLGRRHGARQLPGKSVHARRRRRLRLSPHGRLGRRDRLTASRAARGRDPNIFFQHAARLRAGSVDAHRTDASGACCCSATLTASSRARSLPTARRQLSTSWSLI
jgi:hypothetical protein